MGFRSVLKKLLPPVKGIPVLVYHKVWPGADDALTITPEKLEEQWRYLKRVGYNALSLSDFGSIIAGKMPCPPNAMLITFDDGYKNNLTYAYPLLKKFGWCATIFIIAGTLDGTFESKEHNDKHELMGIADLKMLQHNVMQIAMHGYQHENFSYYPSKEMKLLLARTLELFDNSKLLYYKVVAYPFGSAPGDKGQAGRLNDSMEELGIAYAFTTGNRVCKVPVEDKYKLPRIDIWGTDSIDDILDKITYGHK